MPKSVLPVLFSVPIVLNHSAPRWMISGTCDIVSTLFTVVGHAPQPGAGGERRPFARLALLALDRLHHPGLFAADVRAGAARARRRRSSGPVPMMLLPKKPRS